ncbi:MAG: tyrosine--tRNA ligase [Clostridiales bacterium]|nr:tyrosine--tRNA ligase [Clostridiales bacterium]
MHILDILKERGFVAQVTFEEDLYKALDEGPMTFYVGFDPTADSLHVGHYIPIMAMAHMQRAGHRPIALFGGGTAMVGDPSGRTDLRQMMTKETIAMHVAGIQKQLARFLDFGEGKAMMVNNADWLLDLNYIDFLRDVGSQFSVNRMLAADCYKRRLEVGLTFLEFNYMLMQSYDFLCLFKKHGCRLQLGGDDQWSNMLSGSDLIRRKEKEDAFSLTCKLIMTHDGKKMGKTEKGALWLDPNRCSPFDFYQYWRNVGDQDVERFLGLLTFLPMDEVRRLGALEGSEINEAKRVLAFEVTQLIHGTEEATKAQDAAQSLFAGSGASSNVPTFDITADMLAEDGHVSTILVTCGLCSSRGEARKLMQAGAVLVADEKVTDTTTCITVDQIGSDGLLLRKGKKNYCRLILK